MRNSIHFQLSLFFILISLTSLNAQTFDWAKQFGSMAGGAGGESITIDQAGNTYITGYFFGEVDFDPGPNIYNLNSNGENDIFVAKFNDRGDLIWVHQIGGTGDDYGRSIVIDGRNNICLTGSFKTVVDFDPSTNSYSLTSSGRSDIFVLKLSNSGHFIWANKMGGTVDDEGNSIAVDYQGNIFTTGTYNGLGDFDPGTGIYNLTGIEGEVFVSKLSSNGSFVWARGMGGSDWDTGTSIALDTQGNVYTTGSFYGPADFDPGPDTFMLSGFGDEDIFVNKLDSNGNFVWAKEIGGANTNKGKSIAVDHNSNVFVTGQFRDSVDFDPGGGSLYLSTAGTWGSFVLKLNSLGNLNWVKIMDGTNAWILTESIAIDSTGAIYTAGTFRGVGDFDPSTSVYNMTAMPAVGQVLVYSNVYVSKLDSFGNFIWAKQMGGFNTYGKSLVVNELGHTFFTGNFSGIGLCDFSSGDGTHYLAGSGNATLFSIRLNYLGETVLAKEIGGDLGADVGIAVTNDASGNVYTTGYFSGTVDFDSGIGVTNLSSAAGSVDVYVCKYDPLGNLIWAKKISGIDFAMAQSITVDQLGNVLLTGRFRGAFDFDPGPNTYLRSANGDMDIFVVKLDPLGNFLWAKYMGGTYTDLGASIQTDAQDNIYITGAFTDTVDFDPDLGIHYLYAEGFTDAFICKLDAQGNFLWAKNVGSTDPMSLDIAYSLKLDANNNVYICGDFSGSGDFDPGPNANSLAAIGDEDIFILKLDINGNFLWAKQIGGGSSDFAYGMDVGINGDVYITGSFLSNGIPTDFDPGPNVYNLSPSSSHYDIYICKLDSFGNFLWAKNMGGTSWDVAYSIALDQYDNVYTTGRYYSNADFDPGVGTANLNSTGEYDIFISKLDFSGNFQWVKGIGGYDSEYGQSISIDNMGNVYTTGAFRKTVDFDPNVGVHTLTSVSGDDAFLHKIEQPFLNNKELEEERGLNAIIYPNPTKNHVTIELYDEFESARVFVFNSLGQTISTKEVFQKYTEIYLPEEDGYYFIKVKTKNIINTFKIIKYN